MSMSDKRLWEYCKSARQILVEAASIQGYLGEEVWNLRQATFRKGEISDVELAAIWRVVHKLLRAAHEDMMVNPDRSSRVIVAINSVVHSYRCGKIPNHVV